MLLNWERHALISRGLSADLMRKRHRESADRRGRTNLSQTSHSQLTAQGKGFDKLAKLGPRNQHRTTTLTTTLIGESAKERF
jgi:hypothetical protein